VNKNDINENSFREDISKRSSLFFVFITKAHLNTSILGPFVPLIATLISLHFSRSGRAGLK